MFVQIHELVHQHSKVTCVCAGYDLNITYLYAFDINFTFELWGGEDEEFCLLKIEFQEIFQHPLLDIVYCLVIFIIIVRIT